MSRPGLLAIFLGLSMTAVSQVKPVEITSEPGHHLALQNRYTRVFQVEVPAHVSTLLHAHRHNYLFVTIGPAVIENEVQGKAPVKMKLLDGQTELAKAPFAHVIRNLGDAPFRNVTIEILRPAGRKNAPPQRGLSLDNGLAIQTLYDTDQVRVSEFQLNPGGRVNAGPGKWPHLRVAVSELKLHDQPNGGQSVDLNQRPGDISWSRAGERHALTNLGGQPARWIEVDFK